MKKVISLLMLPLFLFSCARKGDVEEPEMVTLRFTAGIVETKTQLGDKVGSSYPNLWSAGDRISVNGVASSPLENSSGFVGTRKAEFTVTVPSASSYHFAYPASVISNYKSGKAVITLPATQQMTATTYDPAAFIMTGVAQTQHVDVSPLMSVVKLTVPGTYDAKISSVLFESLGTEKVSGPFNTDYSGITARSGASSRVQVYAYGDGAAFGSSLFLLIPAQTYASGMRFTIRATDDTQMTFSTTSSFTAQPGVVYPLTAATYTPAAEVIPDGMMVMSSNVRYASARDKTNDPDTGDRDWSNRKSAYYAMVNTLRPAIIGLQEAEKEQVKDILSNCSGYSHYGLGRKNGKNITADDSYWGLIPGTQYGEESTTVLYRTDLITLNASGTVWLSDTPSTVNSYFPEMEDKQCRTATWVRMTYKPTGKQFFWLNTHTSLYSASHPKEIARIISTVNSNKSGLPVILTADWNLEEDDPLMDPIQNAYYSARRHAQKSDCYETYHWWGTRTKTIDHIFYDGLSPVYLFRTVNRKWNNKYTGIF